MTIKSQIIVQLAVHIIVVQQSNESRTIGKDVHWSEVAQDDCQPGVLEMCPRREIPERGVLRYCCSETENERDRAERTESEDYEGEGLRRKRGTQQGAHHHARTVLREGSMNPSSSPCCCPERHVASRSSYMSYCVYRRT